MPEIDPVKYITENKLNISKGNIVVKEGEYIFADVEDALWTFSVRNCHVIVIEGGDRKVMIHCDETIGIKAVEKVVENFLIGKNIRYSECTDNLEIKVKRGYLLPLSPANCKVTILGGWKDDKNSCASFEKLKIFFDKQGMEIDIELSQNKVTDERVFGNTNRVFENTHSHNSFDNNAMQSLYMNNSSNFVVHSSNSSNDQLSNSSLPTEKVAKAIKGIQQKSFKDIKEEDFILLRRYYNPENLNNLPLKLEISELCVDEQLSNDKLANDSLLNKQNIVLSKNNAYLSQKENSSNTFLECNMEEMEVLKKSGYYIVGHVKGRILKTDRWEKFPYPPAGEVIEYYKDKLRAEVKGFSLRTHVQENVEPYGASLVSPKDVEDKVDESMVELCDAIFKGNLQDVKNILEIGIFSGLNSVAPFGGLPPLHQACIYGRLEIAKVLVAHEASPFLYNSYGFKEAINFFDDEKKRKELFDFWLGYFFLKTQQEITEFAFKTRHSNYKLPSLQHGNINSTGSLFNNNVFFKKSSINTSATNIPSNSYRA